MLPTVDTFEQGKVRRIKRLLNSKMNVPLGERGGVVQRGKHRKLVLLCDNVCL